MSEYNKQAQDFAAKYHVTMTAEYLGHFARLGDHATANFNITLEREGKKPYTFQYSDSLQDSWQWGDKRNRPSYGEPFKKKAGVPPQLRQEHWPAKGGRQDIGHWVLYPVIPKPSLYDILTCLTKYDPGTFDDFCSESGYDADSRKALEIYFAVQKDWLECNNMFHDCLYELQEIN